MNARVWTGQIDASLLSGNDVELVEHAVSGWRVSGGTAGCTVPVTLTPRRRQTGEILGGDLHPHEVELVEIKVLVWESWGSDLE